MTSSGHHLDGNAAAALLQEVLAVEPTTVDRICQSCDARHPIGAHRVYTGAGVVIRCPSCSDVAVRVAPLPGRLIVELRGHLIIDRESRDQP